MKCITVGVCSRAWTGRSAASTCKAGTTSLLKWPTTLSRTQTVLIDPDYNSTSGQSVRIIGYSIIADEVITVIVLEHDGTEYGVNGWLANAKDRHIYNAGTYDAREGEADEQND